MMRSKVQITERGQEGPQEHTCCRGAAPSAPEGPRPLGVHGEAYAAPYPEEGRDTEEEVQGHKGGGRTELLSP